ncbi:MAG: adenylate/guanylate cyclase domain-containing protein [Armatimonadetes bacterium]|nr:adenylate/guanylate cyclase domain-containing protein [Armatimonadota bacterium]
MLERENQTETRNVNANLEDLHTLVSRLRATSGNDIDDQTIEAISEATGALPEYVRVALLNTGTQEKGKTNFRDYYMSLDPAMRRYVGAAVLASVAGFAQAISHNRWDFSGLFGIFTLVAIFVAIWNAVNAPNRRIATLSGIIFGGLSFFGMAVFVALAGMLQRFMPGPITPVNGPMMILLWSALGGGVANLAYGIFAKTSNKLGLKSEKENRQELLSQLMELQTKLRSNEQEMCFVSLDIVGSTAMKTNSDALAVEFTFNEYHKYVEQIVVKQGGRIHSTAGDGVTCAFETPAKAFAASRQIQAGLFELNLHRNKLGTPIRLRAGIHFGKVVSPDGTVENVNFSEVIDIAAHLQKACPEGGIVISNEASRLVPDPNAFSSEIMKVDTVMARVWRPRHTIEASTLQPSDGIA